MQTLLKRWTHALLEWLGLTSATGDALDRWAAFVLVVLAAVVFDLLLQLIFAHRLDVTEIALAAVTDEFIAHLRAQQGEGADWDLSETTEFLVVAATLGVLHVVARRPAVRGTSAEDDALLRTISATRVVRGAQLSQGTALAGVTFFAGATSANAGWWWAWPLLILAVVVLGTALGVALRRVAP